MLYSLADKNYRLLMERRERDTVVWSDMVAMKIERGGRWSAVIGREVVWAPRE
jgi:hypothetical protein